MTAKDKRQNTHLTTSKEGVKNKGNTFRGGKPCLLFFYSLGYMRELAMVLVALLVLQSPQCEWKGFRVGGSFSGLGLEWSTIKSKGTLGVKILKKTERQRNRSIDLCKI